MTANRYDTPLTRVLLALVGGGALFGLFAATDAFHLQPVLGQYIDRNAELALMQLFLLAYLLCACYLCFRRPLFASPKLFFIALCLLIGGLMLRVWCLDRPLLGTWHFTQDYNQFLSSWVAELRGKTVAEALANAPGDYNMPYLYILTLISRSSLPDIYLIKFVSIVADLALTIAVAETVRFFAKKQAAVLLAFGLALFYPITWLNSAYWAQCDVLYAVFVVLAVLFAGQKKLLLSAAMAALAFSFKLQTIFFLPAYFWVLVLLWHSTEGDNSQKLRATARKAAAMLGVFVAVFFAMLAPTLLAGRPLDSARSIYGSQTQTYDMYLCLNCGNLLGIFFPAIQPRLYNGTPDSYNTPVWLPQLFVVLACVYVIALLALTAAKRKTSARDFLTLALLLCMGIVWLLPHMHDRYYYLADILAIIYAVTARQALAYTVPLFVFIGSFSGYSQYLGGYWEGKYMLPLAAGGIAMLAAMGLVLWLWLRKPAEQPADELDAIRL